MGDPNVSAFGSAAVDWVPDSGGAILATLAIEMGCSKAQPSACACSENLVQQIVELNDLATANSAKRLQKRLHCHKTRRLGSACSATLPSSIDSASNEPQTSKSLRRGSVTTRKGDRVGLTADIDHRGRRFDAGWHGILRRELHRNTGHTVASLVLEANKELKWPRRLLRRAARRRDIRVWEVTLP